MYNLNAVTGHIYTFSNGYQFIHNPKYPGYLYTTDGYLDTPDARLKWKELLAQGLTFKAQTVKLFGFEIADHHAEEQSILSWRDMDSACH